MASNHDVLQFREKRFLLIDDMENACSMMRSILVSMGFIRTETAHKLVVAEAMIRKSHFDVILCDNNMGYGETGQMFMERLRRKGLISPRTVFIIISAETYTGSIFAAVEHQPDGYIAKPFVPATLTEKLVQQLRVKEALEPFYCAEEDGEHDQAIRYLKELCQKPLTKAAAQKMLGKKLLDMGQYKQAEAFFRALNDQRLRPWTAVGEAEAIQNLGRPKEAIKILNTLIADNPNAIQGLDALRKIHEASGNERDAYSLLKQVCKLNPTNIDRQSNLGFRALGQHDVQTAVGAFKQALKTASGTPSETPDHFVNVSLGMRKAAQSSLDEKTQSDLLQEASFQLTQATKIFKTDPRLRMHQSLVKSMEYAHRGYNDKAKSEMSKAMETLRDNGLEEQDTLDFIETAYFNKATDIGDHAAKMLIEKFPNDKRVHENIRKVQEGPVNYHDRAEAAKLISLGSEKFSNKQWAESARFFGDALEKAPHSVNLRLNVVHALIFKLREEFTVAEYEHAKNVLSSISSIAEDDPSHKKFVAFEAALRKMEGKIRRTEAA